MFRRNAKRMHLLWSSRAERIFDSWEASIVRMKRDEMALLDFQAKALTRRVERAQGLLAAMAKDKVSFEQAFTSVSNMLASNDVEERGIAELMSMILTVAFAQRISGETLSEVARRKGRPLN